MTGLVWKYRKDIATPLPGPVYAAEALLDTFGAKTFPITVRAGNVRDILTAVRASAKMPEFEELWDELLTALVNHQRIEIERK